MPIDPSKVLWQQVAADEPIDPKKVMWQPVDPLSRTDKLLQGMMDPINGGAQLLTKALPQGVVDAGNQINNWIADKTGLVGRLPAGGVDQQVRQNEDAYQARRAAQGETGFDGWRLAGNVASPVNLATGVGAGTAASTLGTRAALSAAGSGVSSAFQPVTGGDTGGYWADKAKQVGTGLAAGAALPVLSAGVSRVVSPKASLNPDLAMLKAEDVSPTLGQTLGGRWNAAEEKLTSVPILGDAISLARGRALNQFNNAAINRATAPIGVKINGAGQSAVKDAGDALSAAYDAGKAALGHFQLDQQGVSELQSLRAMANQLPAKEQTAFNQVWTQLGGEISPNGSILSDGFKRIDSTIGKKAADFAGSTDAYQRQAAGAFQELQRILLDNAKRANPSAAKMLSDADKGWANLVRIEGASKSGMNQTGIFTPAQLNMAARAADTSVRDRATARGTALMQDLGTAGQNVLGNKVPNSGTADRAWMGLGAVGAGAWSPAIPLGLLGGAAAYTPLLQGLLTGAVSARPSSAKAIAELLNKTTPMLGPAGGLLSLQMTGQ